MKVEVDFGNLEALLNQTLSEEAIKEIAKDKCLEYINQNLKEVIEERTNECFKEYFDTYMKETIIHVGGSYWDDVPPADYSVESYIKKLLKDNLDSGSFTAKVKEKDYYGRENTVSRTMTFADYVKKELDVSKVVGAELEKVMQKFFTETKNEINKKMKEMFDAATRQLLSDTVVSVLNDNATYRNMVKNIAMIADNNS